MSEKPKSIKIVAENRRARHEYHIHETFEAGMVLTGTEIKSLRGGRANLTDSYAKIENKELFLISAHISPYEQGNRFNHEPRRNRKLLMHKAEIVRLLAKTREKGFTLVPLKIYLTHGMAKVELALASGKDLYDKRQSAAEHDAKREVDRVIRDRERQ
ncbi:MAG TPA: SsrA-binding protein SmpB [Negativicutes bacterium]|nr:SsrA-binding protein SmpB [Negativicutes bacterium]